MRLIVEEAIRHPLHRRRSKSLLGYGGGSAVAYESPPDRTYTLGASAMPDRQPGQVHEDSCTLSDREAQVVRLLLTGHRVPHIGALIYLSPSTIRNHLSTVFRKLGVTSQQELTLLFYQLWHEDGIPPATLGGEVLRHPRTLCSACLTPWWR